MKKVLFMTPNYNSSTNPINIGCISLAMILQEKGYVVQFIHCADAYKKYEPDMPNTVDKKIQWIGEYILEQNPDIIDFYTMCQSYHVTVLIAKYVKMKNPNIKIVFGGPQASLTAKLSLEAFSWVDAIGIGEGEKTIERIMNAVSTTEDFSSIPGVAYRKDGKVICNKESDLIENLDELPMLNYDLIDFKNSNRDIACIEPGRGCPFGCTYCSTKTFWKQHFRLKSTDRIINEIKVLKSVYNVKMISFEHDLFTFNKSKVIEFCDRLIDEKLDIKWGCSSRIDTIDEELIRKMFQAGLRGIYIGIETGSPRMQKIINKNLNLKEVWTKIDLLHKYGIQDITLSFIYGFPEETLEDLRQTMDMVKIALEKKIYSVQLHKLWCLPGTQLFEKQKNNLKLDLVFSDITDYTESKEVVDIITNNPHIFPECYSFDSFTRDQYGYIDKFIMSFSTIFKELFSSTFKLLMHYYKDDLIKLYTDFNTYCDSFSFYKRVSYEELELLSLDKEEKEKIKLLRSKVLKDFIDKMDFGSMTELLKDVFQFEFDMVKFMDPQNSLEETINEYKFDVYRVKATGFQFDTSYLTPRKLKFYKSDTGNLKVKLVG